MSDAIKSNANQYTKPLKTFIKSFLPRYFVDLYHRNNHKKENSYFVKMAPPDVFHYIYKNNIWNNPESVSGPGSTLKRTINLRNDLKQLFTSLSIHEIIDLPCGDFNWMKEVDLSSFRYLGLDLVPELIEVNKSKYESENIHFKVANLLLDSIPYADLIFCRDCLVHFSYDHIEKSIHNMKLSGSKYLLTTSFTTPKINYDITTGDWRPINLQIKPFFFPKPLVSIPDEHPDYTSDLGKIVGLWDLQEIKLKH